MMQIDESGHWFPEWDNHRDCPRCRSCDPEDDPCVICDLWDAGTLRLYRQTLFYKEKVSKVTVIVSVVCVCCVYFIHSIKVIHTISCILYLVISGIIISKYQHFDL